MSTEMGELLVGAYLKIQLECDVVDYNVRPPGGGLAGLGELDVIGLRFKDLTAYLCEVTTHLDGLLYKSGLSTIEKIAAKYKRQQAHARDYLKGYKPCFMFWSPIVRRGIAVELQKLEGLELYINDGYGRAITDLRKKAKASTSATNNPAFRLLQILEHTRNN